MIVWTLILSSVVALELVAIFLLTRQVGILLRNALPIGARDDGAGPRIGEDISIIIKDTHNSIGKKSGIIVFLTKSCIACKGIEKDANNLSGYWINHPITLWYDEYDVELSGAKKISM